MALEKYHLRAEHRPRTQHRKADVLSKRTNDYRWREQQLEKLPRVITALEKPTTKPPQPGSTRSPPHATNQTARQTEGGLAGSPVSTTTSHPTRS